VTFGQLVGGQRAEGAAAGGEQDALHVAVAMAFEALEDGVVLTVHGQDVHALALRSFGDCFAGHDEDFLAGDGQMHAGLDCRQGGGESGGADDGDEDHVSVGFVDEIDEPLRSGVQNDIRGSSARALAAAAASVSATCFTPVSRTCSTSASTLLFAARPTICMRSGMSRATLRALVPMEPVEPRRRTLRITERGVGNRPRPPTRTRPRS
jgi:hypothetical protein